MMTRPQWLAIPLIALASLALVACSGSSGSDNEAEPADTPTATPTPTPTGADTGALAKTVVQIFGVDSFGDAWTGSGTLISADGLILTNAHVVSDSYEEYEELTVAITNRTDEPPEVAYVAEVIAIDYALDLAVIQITSDLNGYPVVETFPFITLGDSDEIEIGDELRILGYPGIGGETITLTNGVVSGFTSERGVGGRAWIKTDATIAGGNSGGLAVDNEGRIIGVPTIAASGAETGEFVDCRQIVDTNRDGFIDDLDTCVPVGGFINGLRPVSLALALIDAATSGDVYVSKFEPEPEPVGGFDTTFAVFSDIVFADGVTAYDEPTEALDAIPSGADEVCGFWDYEGMVDSASWDAIWFVDGEFNDEGSFIAETWEGGETGNWWVCVIAEDGLLGGTYELVLSVEGEYMGSGTVFVGGYHPPVELYIENGSSVPICYVYLVPPIAQNWGFDKLGMDYGIDTGETRIFQVPAGEYDLALDDCDQQPLIEEYGLDISEDTVYTVTD